jgi:hypothetical protein
MNGMEIMLKSFGIDPEKIKAEITMIAGAVKDMDERISRIEEKLDKILGITKQENENVDITESITGKPN